MLHEVHCGKNRCELWKHHQTSFLRCFEIVFRFHFSHYLKMYIYSKIKPCTYHFRVTQPWRRKRTKQNGRPDSKRRIKRLKGGNCELHILYDLSSTLKWNIYIKMRDYTHFFLIDKDLSVQIKMEYINWSLSPQGPTYIAFCSA